MDMKVSIEEGGYSQVVFKEKPTNGQQNFNLRMPLDITFKVSLSPGSKAYETAFRATFILEMGVVMQTQGNKVFAMIDDIKNAGLEIKEDKVDIVNELELFEKEFDRFLSHHLNLFNEALYEDSYISKIPKYFRLDFTYLEGAMIAEVNFNNK